MELIGKRITLRDKTLADIDVETHWLQPGHRWKELDGPYYPHHVPSPEEVEDSRKRLAKHIEENNWPDPRQRLIIALDDVCIGMVSRYWISEETNWPAVGLVIYDPAYWQQGLGFEALSLWCDYLFNSELEFERLDLRTWSGNIGMMRLAEKLGFTLEARFRKARIVNGDFYDGIGYGILRDEWLK